MSLVRFDEQLQKIPVRIPILTYHSIDDSGSIISTKPDTFRQQMEFLSDAGYQAVTLKQLISTFFRKRNVPFGTFVLTFDDGFQNFYTEAFPVLEEFGFTATVFLVTGHCGKFNDWLGNPPELPRSEMLSPVQVEELSRHGIEFGAHTITHTDLTKLSEKSLIREMAGSKAVIEDITGREAGAFAYPYGRHNAQVRKIAEGIFDAACSTNLGKVTRRSDLYSLERIDTYYLSDRRIFEALSKRSLDRYLRVRQAVRSFRSAIKRN